MNNYDILLYSPDRNVKLISFYDINSLDYVLNDKAAGAMTLVIPPVVPRSFLTEGTQVEIWRAADDGTPILEGGTQWFVNRVEELYSAERLFSITAVDGMDLLNRRRVMYPAGVSQTSQTLPADDLMKFIIRLNMPAAPPITGRYAGSNIFLPLFSVEPDSSLLPTIRKGFSWAKVMDTLQDIAADSFAAGVFASFRIVQIDSGTGALQFRTYANSLGPDRRASRDGLQPGGLILSPENGSISEASIVEDWTESYTTIVIGGEGVETDRALGGAVVGPKTPWGYRENFIEKTDTNSIRELTDYAKGQLQLAQPKRRVIGTINPTSNVRYGRDFGLGYLVTAQVGDFLVDCRVNQVSVNLTQEGGEIITAQITSEETIL